MVKLDASHRTHLHCPLSFAQLSSCVVLLLLVGCGSSNGLIPVQGHVVLDGKPISNAAVLFMPQQGLPAQGITDEQGRFELTTLDPGDGAAAGNYTVTVTCREVTGKLRDEGDELPFRGYVRGTMKVRWIVPEHYSTPATSPLHVDVSEDMESVELSLSSTT